MSVQGMRTEAEIRAMMAEVDALAYAEKVATMGEVSGATMLTRLVLRWCVGDEADYDPVLLTQRAAKVRAYRSEPFPAIGENP